MPIDIGPRITVDGEKEYRQQMQEIINISKNLASEMKLVESEFDSSTSAENKAAKQKEVLTKQIANQTKEVELLKKRYEESAKKTGENSAETLKLKTQYNQAQTYLNKYNAELAECEKQMSSASSKSSEFGKKLKSGIASAAKASAKALGAVTAAATAAAVKFGVDAVKSAGEAGDAIDKQSQKIKVSAEEYQKLAFAAERSGTSVDVFKTASKALASTDFSGNVYDAVLAVSEISDADERAAKATELFGKKAGQELLPLLNSGKEGVQGMFDEVEQLGGVMSNEAVASAAAFEDSLTNLQTSLTGVKNNLGAEFLPAVTEVIGGLTDIVSGDIEGGSEKITEAVQTVISEVLPTIVNLVTGLLPGLSAALQTLLSGILTVLPTLITSITGFLLNDFVPAILNMLPEIISAGMEIILSLALGIADALPTLIPQIVDIMLTICETLLAPDNIAMLIGAAFEIIIALAEGLIKSLPDLITRVPEIIAGIEQGLLQGIGKIFAIGGQLLVGLWNGINDKLGWLKDKILGFGSTVLETIKGIFGIHSPSRVMRDMIGKNLALGIGEGFNDEIGGVMNDMQKSLDTSFTMTAPISSLAYAGAGGYSNSSFNYNIPAINVYAAAGQSADEIANATLYKLQRQIESKKAVWR